MEKYIDEKSRIVRESIGESILRLLKDMEFSKISVCDICEVAGVGRTTYYRYYGNKTGKEDAIINWFIIRWEALFEAEQKQITPAPGPETDDMYKKYLYLMKSEILLLADNNLVHIWDSFILYIYGSEKPAEDDLGNYYLKYFFAGLWIGYSHSVIDRKFSEDAELVDQLFMKSFQKAIENATALDKK